MPNPYVNKVVQSNGTTLIDISDTTAVASDVASGKYFYLASGEKVPGAGSGGGGSSYTRTVIAVEQTVTPTSNGTYYSATLNVSEGFEADAEYIITYNSTEYFFTCQVMWGTNYLLGDINYFYGGSDLPYPFGIIWMNGTTCTFARNSGNQVTIKIEKLELTGSGGGGGSSTLITKTITANGTYLAEDDDADGYSSVTVNVPSGASNVVTGTFKGTTTGAAMDVTLNYSGSGYPIAVMIYPSNANESTFQSTIQRYAVRDCMLEKYAKATSPTYSKTGDGDRASFTAKYKSSSSSPANYSNGGSTVATQALYADEAATNNVTAIVKIRSKTKISVFIASSSYGFMANIEYSYVVIYSS